MIRTFRALIEVDPGFVMPSDIQTFRVDIPYIQVKEPERVMRIEEEILHKIEAVPGVSSVSLSMSVPLDGNQTTGPAFEKGRTYSQGELPLHRFRFVAPGFFKTLGTPLVAGRDLDRKSTRLNSSHRCSSYAVFCLKKKNNKLLHT